jgi:hypothetical protein
MLFLPASVLRDIVLARLHGGPGMSNVSAERARRMPTRTSAIMERQSVSSDTQFGNGDEKSVPEHSMRQPSKHWKKVIRNRDMDLPDDRRRPLASRVDAILAEPRAGKCTEPCWICERVPDEVADAALAAWDALARAGTWPIAMSRIVAILRENGISGATHKPVHRVIGHRRWYVLDRLVRRDIEEWQRALSESETTEKAPA